MTPKARALLSLFVVIVFNQTEASTECKNTVMDIIMEQCHGFGSRFKKQEVVPRLDDGTGGRHIGKRYVQEVQVARRIVHPKVPKIFRDTFHVIRQNGNNYYRNQRFPLSDGYPVYLPFKHNGNLQLSQSHTKLPEEGPVDLAFKLNGEETDEVYNEVKRRMPRSSWTKELLIGIAVKCCQNVIHCRKEPPCM